MPAACSRRSAELALDLVLALGGGLVLADGDLLDLELLDAALDLVDLGRDGGELDRDARRGLVDEVDRLVGQEAVGDVAVADSVAAAISAASVIVTPWWAS